MEERCAWWEEEDVWGVGVMARRSPECGAASGDCSAVAVGGV